MKLPSVNSAPVQGFNNPSISTIASGAGAFLTGVGQGVGAIGQAVSNYERQQERERLELDKRKKEIEARDAALEMSRNMTEFHEKYGGRDYIGIDEIPEGINVQRTRKQVNQNGQLEEVVLDKVPAYEVMPQLLRHYQKAYIESNSTKITDLETRKEWTARAQTMLDSDYIRELEQSRQQQSKFVENKTISEIETAVSAGKFELARELSNSFDNPLLASKANELIVKSEYLSGVDSLILDPAADINAIDDKIAELSAPDAELPISANERKAKVAALESNKQRVMAASMAARERSRQQVVSDTWLAIDSGRPEANEAWVEDLFDKETIDGGTRTAMIRAIKKGREDQINLHTSMAELEQVAAAGYGIDPKNKDLRKAVDMQFEQRAQETGDPWGTAINMMQQYKVIPNQIAGMFRSANRAESPEIARATELFMYAQDYAPESLKDFSDTDVNVIENVAANVRLGMSIPDAIATTQKWESMTPDQKQTIKQNTRMAWDTNNAVLDDLVGDHPAYDKPWSLSAPEVSSVMRQEYDSLVERMLPTVGFDISVAQRKAFGHITRTWSMTDVNGEYKLMKNMPTAPTEDIRKQIRSSFADQIRGLQTSTGREFKASDVKIASDSLTQIQINRGMKPTYQAFIVLDPETQEIQMLPRFEWDGEKASKDRKAKIMEDARKERQQFLEEQQRKQKEKELLQQARDLQFTMGNR